MIPYTLNISSNVLQTDQYDIASIQPPDWKRSVKRNGGFWLGDFTLTEEDMDLHQAFDTWLGNNLEERVGGRPTWEGIVYEMEFTHQGVTRKRSLDEMWNSVKSTYVTTDFVSTGKLENTSFEDGGPGVFLVWVEDDGLGLVTQNADHVTGSWCVDIQAGTYTGNRRPGSNGFDSAWVRQGMTVSSGSRYRLDFWYKGTEVWIGFRNPAISRWLTGSPKQVYYNDGVSRGTWTRGYVEFTGPGNGQLIIFLSAGDKGEWCRFDDVDLMELGKVIYQTDVSANETSIDKFGTKRELLMLDNYPMETAEMYRDSYLAEFGSPWARATSFGDPGPATLRVTVAGYAFTANWQYENSGSGLETDLDDWLSAIVGSSYSGGDCEYLKTGNIESNTAQVVQTSSVPLRAWDQVIELIDIGIESGGDYFPTTCWVDFGRKVHYEMLNTTPRYYIRGGNWYTNPGGTNPVTPWEIRPGVVRDLTFPEKNVESGSFLSDARDVLIEEVTIGPDGKITPRLSTLADTEIEMENIQRLWGDYMQQVEQRLQPVPIPKRTDRKAWFKGREKRDD